MPQTTIRLLFWIVVACGLIVSGCRGAGIVQILFSLGITAVFVVCVFVVCYFITKE